MLRCIDCRMVFEAETIQSVTSCPNCGSTQRPENPEWDVTLTMNWNDIRVMAIWARRFALTVDDRSRKRLEHSLIKLQSLAPNGAPAIEL